MRVGFREWRVVWDHKSKEPVLYSTFIDYAWETGSETADQLPEQHTEDRGFGRLHGLHAVLDWDRSKFLRKPATQGPKVFVHGAVDMHGLVREHEDGVVRAEYLRVLALRLMVLPYLIPPCEHQDRLWVVNRVLEEGRLVIQHCTCFSAKVDEMSGQPPGPFDYRPTPLIAYESFTPKELEDMLMQKYEVPKLPMGVGPWEPPWGSGPVPERDLLGDRSEGH